MTQNLAALVGSRICHDLISPIGAISNGFELLTLTQTTSSEEMSLIGGSVDSASARIRFFRVAFGAAENGQVISLSEVRDILDSVANGGRFAYVWDSAPSVSRVIARLIFLIIQCVEASLPTGGTIYISQNGNDWRVMAEHNVIQLKSELWDGLTQPVRKKDYTSAEVQFALLPPALADAERSLDFSYSDGRIEVRI